MSAVPSAADLPIDPTSVPRATPTAAHRATGSGTESRPVAVTVRCRVDLPVAEAFTLVVPIDLATIFRGYGPLPAVVGASSDGTVWGRVGQQRTVELADGTHVQERVVDVAEPGRFAYEVVPTSGPLRLLVRRIDGRFVFSRSEFGGTSIRWTYVFRPRRGRRPALRLLAPVWRRYARQVMAEIARAADAAGGVPTAND